MTPVAGATTGGPGGVAPEGGGKRPGGAGGGGRSGGGGGRRGGGGAGGMVSGMLSRYDTNKDDVIDATEMAALEGRSKDFIGGADTDKDGSVTKAELTKLASSMASRGGGGGGGPNAAPAGAGSGSPAQ